MPVEFGVVNFLYRARLEFVDQPVKNDKSLNQLFNHLQELLYPGQGCSGFWSVSQKHLAQSGNDASPSDSTMHTRSHLRVISCSSMFL